MDCDNTFPLTSKLCPLGTVCPAALGLYTCIKSWKNCIKSDFKEIILKLVANDRSIRHFCWHQNFVPWGLSAPGLRLYTWIKSWKKCINSDFKDIFLNLQQMNEVTRHFCWHQNFVPWGLSVPALGLYTCIKSWKRYCIKSDFKEIVFFYKLATTDRSDMMFLLASKFHPQGVVSPCLGAIYMYKIIKKIV